jgi:putative SOS response-associated peptidase YedK
MCGRYSITVDERALEERFGSKFISGHFEPAYNAASSQLSVFSNAYFGVFSNAYFGGIASRTLNRGREAALRWWFL